MTPPEPQSRGRSFLPGIRSRLGFGARSADTAEVADVGTGSGIDTVRVRTFLGLSLGLVGARANLAVSGVLLTLLVSSRVSSAVAITFALTANRFVGWIAYPLLGRASDRTRSVAGRRAPHMAAGLFLMGACTWAYTLV